MPPRMKPNIEASDLKNELLLYDAGDDAVHVLNETGRLILNAHLRGLKISEIEVMLKDTYALGPSIDVKDEIGRFLEDLKRKKILEA